MKNNYLDFAIKTAKEAGDNVLMGHYGKLQNLEWTTRQHFRTSVDKESDELIRQRIKETFPKHNIYSEEQESMNQGSEFSWVIDPLDGTIPYTLGISDHFSVCIALAKNKNPIIGVIYSPKRKEMYYTEKGKGAFCNERRIKVSKEENINHAIIGLDGGKETSEFKRQSLAPYIAKALSPQGVSCITCYGCASLPISFVAKGNLHAYTALSLEPWDMAAGVIINREAGAKVTNIHGARWDLDEPSIITANPKLHKKIINLLNK